MSPGRTRIVPSPHSGRACCRAWPLPRRSRWTTERTSEPASATTSSPFGPTTRTIRSARARAVRSGYAIRGRPHSGWSTLGCRERIRLPSPAARMTAVTWFIGVWIILPRSPRATIRDSPKTHSGPPLVGVAQMRQEALDTIGNRRDALDHFPESRMHEGERRRVQRVAVERDRRARAGLSVDVVADDGMAQRGQVYADLVGAPRLQARLERREVGEALEHAIARDRALATAGGADRHLDPIARMAPDRRVDDPLARANAPVHDGEIAARHRARGHLLHQVVVGCLRLGDDQKARGVLVVPVDDAGPPRSPDPRDGRRVREQRCGERPGG